MANDIAIFLDLDNLVIGAREENFTFDVSLVIQGIKQRTGGRIVLRRAYSGNPRPDPKVMKEVAAAGFTTQAAVALNNYGKNLVDMYMVVDTMDTLVDGQEYGTYVLVTGDRDFVPLIHALRRRGKHVIGVGLRHTTTENLSTLCDEFIYYEDLLPAPPLSDIDAEALLTRAVDSLLATDERVRASMVKERMIELSHGRFGRQQYSDVTFSKFLARFPKLVTLEQEATTTYVRRATRQETVPELHRRYRSELKKQKLRIVPPRERLILLKELIALLEQEEGIEWRQLADRLAERYLAKEANEISRNLVNSTIVLARSAGVIRTAKARSLVAAPLYLNIEGPRAFQESVIRCDMLYLEAIRALPDPFNLTEAALALYDQISYTAYLRQVLSRLEANHPNGTA